MSSDNIVEPDENTETVDTSTGRVTVRITHSFPLGGHAQWVTAGVDGLTPLPGEEIEDTVARGREIAIDAVFDTADEFTDRAKARTTARRREQINPT